MIPRIFSLLLFFAQAGQAATLTLDEAANVAKKQNPEILKLKAAAGAADWGKLEALSEHLPHVQARGTHLLGTQYGRLGVRFGGTPVEMPTAQPQTMFDIEASLLIFDGFGSYNHYRAASLRSEAARLDYERAVFQLEENIKIKFYRALAAQDLAKVAEQNIKTLDQHLKLARVGERAGASLRVDVLRLESQMEEAQAEKLLADDNAFLSRKILFEALGESESDKTLEGRLPVPEENRIPDSLTFNQAQRQDVDAQLKREAAAEKQSSAAGSHWLPKVSLFAGKQFYKYGDFDSAIIPNDDFQSSYAYGVRMTWNLFDGGASIARNGQAEAAAVQAEQTTKQVKLTSLREFDTYKRRYKYDAALYLARKRTVERSVESVRLATLSLRAGSKTHSDVLDTELDLFRSKEGLVHAQVEAIEALANLELALGHKL